MGEGVISCSVISCDNNFFFNTLKGPLDKGGALWRVIWKSIRNAARDQGSVKWFGHSTSSSSIMACFFFTNEREAEEYKGRVEEQVARTTMVGEVQGKVRVEETFLVTAEEFGLGSRVSKLASVPRKQ